MQVQNANMEGGMLEMYTSPADLRKQQVADLQAKRQEKVTVQHGLSNLAFPTWLVQLGPFNLAFPPSACICLPYGSFPQYSAPGRMHYYLRLRRCEFACMSHAVLSSFSCCIVCVHARPSFPF